MLGKPDIVFIIGREGLQLKKLGKNFKGLCPFHDEKTPSFLVNSEKQIFHCFGCGAHGDVLDFVVKYHGLSFKDALKHLGMKSGAPPKPNPEIERRKKLLKAFKTWKRDYYFRLCDRALLLEKAKRSFQNFPNRSESVAFFFAEQIAELEPINHKLDCLLENDQETTFLIFKGENHERTFSAYERA
jgi:DNA primase catalytic core